MTAPRCRYRSCIARILRATAPRRCCSTATAPTAWRCRRRSPPTGCRWSIAALSMPSPISAAAPTRAGAGISTASARRRPTPLTISPLRARALIAAKYTGTKRIVAHGGSAGGMLMGAVANRAGELFAGIVAEVPFVDVLNTMLDDTLPLTPPEWPEWGNPIESKKDFRDHPVLLALRQCRGEGLSGDPRDGRADRPARHLLGAGQMDRAAARHHDEAAARCCCAPTWAPATAAPRGASTGSTRSRSRMLSRCGRWEWRRRARREQLRCLRRERIATSSVIPGRAKCEPGISSFRVQGFALPRNDGSAQAPKPVSLTSD